MVHIVDYSATNVEFKTFFLARSQSDMSCLLQLCVQHLISLHALLTVRTLEQVTSMNVSIHAVK